MEVFGNAIAMLANEKGYLTKYSICSALCECCSIQVASSNIFNFMYNKKSFVELSVNSKHVVELSRGKGMGILSILDIVDACEIIRFVNMELNSIIIIDMLADEAFLDYNFIIELLDHDCAYAAFKVIERYDKIAGNDKYIDNLLMYCKNWLAKHDMPVPVKEQKKK